MKRKDPRLTLDLKSWIEVEKNDRVWFCVDQPRTVDVILIRPRIPRAGNFSRRHPVEHFSTAFLPVDLKHELIFVVYSHVFHIKNRRNEKMKQAHVEIISRTTYREPVSLDCCV